MRRTDPGEVQATCISTGSHGREQEGTWLQLFLDKEMNERGIPVLELDVEYGESGSGQTRTRVEAFLEMVQNQAKEPTKQSPKRNVSK